MSLQKDHQTKYQGVAMITSVPFDRDGKIDIAEYRRVIEHQISAGISIVQCPLADELYYLTDEENALVMETLAETCKGKALSCAIASHSPTVGRIVSNARLYESLGIDVIKVLCPLHFGMDFEPEDIYSYYAQVIEAVKVPIMIYNQPRRAGVNVPPKVIARLVKDYEQVKLLEETNFNQITDVKAIVGESLSIFVKFPFWLSASVLGCDGMYSWLPYAPAEVQELSALCISGRYDEAETLFYERYDLYSLTEILSVTSLKFGLNEAGFKMGGVRAPVREKLLDPQERRFREAIRKHVQRLP